MSLEAYVSISKKNTIQKVVYWLLMQIISDCWLWPLKKFPNGKINVI